MRDVDDTTDGGISFTEFHGAAKEAEAKHALHLKESRRHHAAVVEHKALKQMKGFNNKDSESLPSIGVDTPT